MQIDQNKTPLYNSRLLNVYLKLLIDRYPEVNIDDVLNYAGIEYYEILDEGIGLNKRKQTASSSALYSSQKNKKYSP